MVKVNNIRFPHKCTIYKLTGGDEWTEGKKEVVYSGECRLYNNDSIRTFYRNTNRGRLSYGDYAVNIPATGLRIEVGMFLDATTNTGYFNETPILDVYAGNLGTTIYISNVKQ